MKNSLFIFFIDLLIIITSCNMNINEPQNTASSISSSSTFPWVSYNPGLKNSDGSAHIIPGPFQKTGTTINVTLPPYNCDPLDNEKDDRPGIEAAITAASQGDEIYLPNGVYNLKTAWSTDPKSNIRLKTKVNIRGESQDGVILKTYFDDVYTPDKPAGTNSYFVIRGYNVNNIHIKNLTITSTWNKTYSTNTRTNNTQHGGPNNCILLSSSTTGNTYTYNIYIENVTAEKFLNIGIKVANGCYDVVLKNCKARNATDVAGGGCGYGFQLSGNYKGNGLLTNPNLGTTEDNYFNMIDSCTIESTYIRHAALIQYWAHNNLITNCNFKGTLLDAIDLHGEDEYNNEVCFNTVENVSGESAIGIGNSGGTSVLHDKSGPHNYIHDNTIINCKYGISVQYNTPYTKIENNIIKNYTSSNGRGIRLGNAPSTIVINNTIENNTGSSYYGFHFFEDVAMGVEPAGSPIYCQIKDNKVLNNTNAYAFKIDAGSNNTFLNNIASGNSNNTLP